MDSNGLFWLLVFPMIVIAVLYYLGFLTVGTGLIAGAFKSGGGAKKPVLLLVGVCIVIFPFILPKVQNHFAEKRADARQEVLANMERVDLRNWMPRKFVTISGYSDRDIKFIKRYGLSQYPKLEDERLRNAYRLYRRAEFCHRNNEGKSPYIPGTKLKLCRDVPDSIQNALKLTEPTLFFVEGFSTSYRTSNILAGKIYEVRLITPSEDLLVDYYEQRTVEDKPSITKPFSSGLKRDHTDRPPTKQAFIKTALAGARRS